MPSKNDKDAALKAIADAAVVAATAAATASEVARNVASKAAETAAAVVSLASKTTDSILLLGNDITYIKADLSEVKKKLEVSYVTQEAFAPVKMITFGLVGMSLIGIVGGLLALIIKK